MKRFLGKVYVERPVPVPFVDGAPPAQFRSLVTVQRGIPFVSIWHVGYWLSLPAQQSAFVLQDIEPPTVPIPGLQSAPAGLHTVEA